MNQAEIIAENLKRLLKERNKKPADMARSTNISESTLSGYMNAKNIPRMGKIQQMARFLEVNTTDITNKYDPNNFSESAILSIPVIGEIHDIRHVSDPENFTGYMRRLAEAIPKDVKYAIHTDEGELEIDAMISEQNDAPDGTLVAIVEAEGQKPILRKIQHTEDGYMFYTGDKPPILVKKEQAHILGVVKRIILDV